MLLFVFTVVTWEYQDGYSSGMGRLAMPLHLLFPVVAGVVVRPWPQNGVFAETASGLMDMVLPLSWGGVLTLLGRVEPGSSTGLLDALPFMVAGVAVCAGLGALGAWLGKRIARLLSGSSKTRPTGIS